MTAWAAAAGVIFLAPRAADATVVERIVAVVGDRPVLLSELRERAHPLMLRVYGQSRTASERAAGLSQIYKHTLDTLIDELLEQRAANDADISVTQADVDRMLQVVATQNGLSVQDLLREASKSGLSETQYRDELKRQTLAMRIAEWRFQGRIRATESDMREAYDKAAREAESRRALRAAWIVVKTGRGARVTPEKAALVETISQSLKAGEDFAELAKKYSEDARSAGTGGLLGETTAAQLPFAVQRSLSSLQVGQVSAPLQVGATTVFLKLIERAPLQLPSFAKARAGLEQQVRGQKMNEARKQWLRTLRRRTHVEVRL